MDKLIKIEVAYALPKEQTLLALSVSDTISVVEAIKLSGILQKYPEIDLQTNHIGIFGKRVANPEIDTLRDGDRIEIYRALQIDPKEARRRRAEKVANKKSD